jgi:putative DNA primase/helicase
MIEGCLKWQRNGLKIPTLVRKATDDYRSDMDTVGQWMDEFVEFDEVAVTPIATV